MINSTKLEIRVALFTLQQIFGTEYIVSGSVADYLNICDKIQYFQPKDLDITLTINQLYKLKQYFFVRKVEGLYKQNIVSEYFATIGGCSIDIFVKEDIDEDTDIYEQGDWKIRKQSRKERLKQHNVAINLSNISDYRKRKHLNRLTFYKLQNANSLHS